MESEVREREAELPSLEVLEAPCLGLSMEEVESPSLAPCSGLSLGVGVREEGRQAARLMLGGRARGVEDAVSLL